MIAWYGSRTSLEGPGLMAAELAVIGGACSHDPIIVAARIQSAAQSPGTLSFSRTMRSADPLVTVSIVARDHSAEASSRRPLLAASGQPQWPAIAVLAVCVALITLASSGGPYPHDRGQRLLLAFVICAPIAALRRWPLPVLAAATIANTMAMAAGKAPLPFGIMLGLASYLAASRLPRRVSIRAAAASAAALGGALVYATLTARNASVAVEAVEGFLPLVAGWFTGDSIAARRRYLAGLAEQAERERAAEAERARQQVREERVDLHMSGTDRPLSAALELSVYRVVQEALTNVVKHAPGARAAVDLAVSDREIRLDVTDDGRPAGPPGLPAGGERPAGAGERQAGPGHGIVGMRERIGAFGGRLVAEPLAGRGFRVTAQVPIEGAV
jgi:hypothetical protein